MKIDKMMSKIYNDEQRLKDKIAIYKNDKRIIAIRLDVERDFTIKNNEVTFNVYKQFVNRIEIVNYKVDKELTSKLKSSDTKKEFSNLLNEHVANVIEVLDKSTTTTRETCTLRKRFAKFFFNVTKDKKFVTFEEDSEKQVAEVVKVTKVKAKSKDKTSAKAKSQHDNIAKAKSAKAKSAKVV